MPIELILLIIFCLVFLVLFLYSLFINYKVITKFGDIVENILNKDDEVKGKQENDVFDFITKEEIIEVEELDDEEEAEREYEYDKEVRSWMKEE